MTGTIRGVEFTRTAILNWLRDVGTVAIEHRIIEGVRVTRAIINFRGEDILVDDDSADQDDRVVRMAADEVRARMGMTPMAIPIRDVATEREIVLAHLAGDNDRVEHLTRQMVMQKAAKPRALNAKIKRDW